MGFNGPNQVLTWLIDGVPTNTPHALTYEASVDPSGGAGVRLTNTAVSEFNNERSPVARSTVTVTTNGYTTILKTSDVDYIPNDAGDGVGEGAWTVTIRSFDPLPQAFTDTIDILPYNGDQRGTSFSGTYTLDDVIVPPGSAVYYTTTNPAALSDDPADPSNGSAGSTAGNLVGWTTTRPPAPSTVTAIRVIGGVLAPGATRAFRVVITTAGAELGDVYVNAAQARAGHTRLVMRTSAALRVTDYTVTKTSDPVEGSPLAPGNTITYTIRVSQQGPAPAGAVFSDDLSDVLDNADLQR